MAQAYSESSVYLQTLASQFRAHQRYIPALPELAGALFPKRLFPGDALSRIMDNPTRILFGELIWKNNPWCCAASGIFAAADRAGYAGLRTVKSPPRNTPGAEWPTPNGNADRGKNAGPATAQAGDAKAECSWLAEG